MIRDEQVLKKNGIMIKQYSKVVFFLTSQGNFVIAFRRKLKYLRPLYLFSDIFIKDEKDTLSVNDE
jgi:hypothetical protein